jgi:hypothetical protein
MQNKTKKRWLDVQIILASLAVTGTLALWNVFAKASRPVTPPTGTPSPDPSATFTVTPTTAASATATAGLAGPIRLPTVHMLLGGKAPVVQPVVVVNSPASGGSGSSSSGSGTSASSGTTNPAPPPVTNTTSSKP